METTEQERQELILRQMEERDISISDIAWTLGMRYDVIHRAIYEGKGNPATYNLLADYFHMPRRLLVGNALDRIPVNPDPTWNSLLNHVNKVLADAILPLLSEADALHKKETRLARNSDSAKYVRKTVENTVDIFWQILSTCIFKRDEENEEGT